MKWSGEGDTFQDPECLCHGATAIYFRSSSIYRESQVVLRCQKRDRGEHELGGLFQAEASDSANIFDLAEIPFGEGTHPLLGNGHDVRDHMNRSGVTEYVPDSVCDAVARSEYSIHVLEERKHAWLVPIASSASRCGLGCDDGNQRDVPGMLHPRQCQLAHWNSVDQIGLPLLHRGRYSAA